MGAGTAAVGAAEVGGTTATASIGPPSRSPPAITTGAGWGADCCGRRGGSDVGGTDVGARATAAGNDGVGATTARGVRRCLPEPWTGGGDGALAGGGCVCG